MIRAAVRDPLVPVPAKILSVTRETEDTFTLVLDTSSFEGGFRFEPGQFNMLWLFGTGEVPISISGHPAHAERLVHTIRAVGSVTEPMKRLWKDDVLGVRGPFGTSWPLASARGRDLVIVAGGLGLAPLRPAILQVLDRRADFGKVVIAIGARTPDGLIFRQELERWRGRLDVDVRVTVDHADAGWRGDVGVVTQLLGRGGFDGAKTTAFLCGPEVMMRFAARELEHHGVTQASIHVSLERNMKCAVAFCGHCQLGPSFVCREGAVYRLDRIAPFLAVREL